MPNQQTAVHSPLDDDEGWLNEPAELPRRPRQRLLAPIPLTLLAVLLIACGFIGGVLVEKGQSSSGSADASLGARFAALRGGASSTGQANASSGRGGGGFLGGGGAGGGGGRAAGQVAYLAGRTLYVTTAEGNTVKVTTSANTIVSKSVTARVKSIHPGETVTIIGTTRKDGALSAESIDVGSSGGGLAALLGAGAASSGPKGAGGGASAGAPALFGNRG